MNKNSGLFVNYSGNDVVYVPVLKVVRTCICVVLVCLIVAIDVVHK